MPEVPIAPPESNQPDDPAAIDLITVALDGERTNSNPPREEGRFLAPPHIFGEVVWLMRYSTLHFNQSIIETHRLILPAIDTGQCRVYRKAGKIFGFVSWAFLTEEAEQGYIESTRKLAPEDWNAGDRMWIVDIIFPFGGFDSESVREDFRNQFPEDAEASWLRYEEACSTQVHKWYGMALRRSPKTWWEKK